jgi:hypothetical protein
VVESGHGRDAIIEPMATARQLARGLWIAWAIVVWNVVFDHVIVVAGRDYLTAALVAARGPGPYAHMDDWMRPAITHGLWIATAASGLILLVGFAGIHRATSRKGPDHAVDGDR